MADKDFVVKNGLVVNTNALVVDGSTNKVGVNTASPDAAFSVVGTANVTGNVTFSSNLSVNGNTYINGRFEVNNNAYIDKKLYVGNTQTMIQDLPTIIQAVDNFNGFVMISSQNLSKLDDACADLITYADNTNGLSHFNDVGINNSRFDGTIHRVSANTLSDSFVLGETIFQRNNAGANIAVGILRDRTVINATSRSLKISIQESDGLKTTLGAPQYTNTAGANLSLRGVTSGVNSSVLVAVGFFESDGVSGAYSRRNFPFTIGRRGDGYLYNANSALSIGTTGGGMRTDEQTISVSFISGANQITLSSGNTDLMYSEMIVTGTGIPVDAYITSIANSITFNLSKPTTAGSSGAYTVKDPYYDISGNPIIFHVGGMTANDEIARFVGNGNFVIGPNTTSRADKFTVAGTANITGNVAFGNNLTVAGNAAVTGTVNASAVLVGANVALNTSAVQVGNTIANLVANSILVKVANSTSTANLTPADLKIGATTVVNSTQVTATTLVGNLSASYANITGQVNTATLYAATSANIASAVQANATGIYTTGSVNAASYNVGTSFTANSTVVNAVSYYSGTLFVANTTVINATHLVGATWAAPLVLVSTTANGASLTYANVSGQVNTATLYATTSANIASVVQANSTGMFTTATANALNFTAGAGFGAVTAGMVANSGTVGVSTSATANAKVTAALIQVATNLSIANLTAVDLKIGSSVVNSSIIAVGSNVSLNTSAMFIGNTIANAVVNSTLIQVANDTNIANLTPIDLKFGGTTVVNTTQVTATLFVGNVSGSYANITGQVNTSTLFATTSANVGANVQLTTSQLSVGNSIVNTSHTSALMQIANTITIANVSAAGIQAYTNSTVNSTVTASLVQVSNSTSTTNVTALGIQAYTNSIVNSTVTASLVQVSNASSTANLTAADLKIGATTVVNSTQVTATLLVGNVSGSYANITGQVNTATLYAATSANIASAVQANATGVYTTGTMNAASHTVGTAFTANATVVNAVSYYSGTLLVANTTVINATHLVGATWAVPSILGSATANGASLTYANVSGQVNTATLYATTTANVGANVQLTTSQLFVGNSIVNTIHTSTLMQVSNSTTIANVTAAGIQAYTNSTVNSTVTASLLQVSNSTSTANLTAADLKIGSTVVNSSQVTSTSFAGNTATISGNLSSGNTAITGSLTVSTNVATIGNSVYFTSGGNVGFGNTTPNAKLQVTGDANVSGNLVIGGNFTVVGTFTTAGTTTASGDFVPSTNNSFSLGNTTLRWANVYVNNAIMNLANAVNFIGTTVNATANISVGANVVANLTTVKVGDATNYSIMSNSIVETTGNVYLATGVVIVGTNVTMNTTTMKIGNSIANTIANSIVIRISDSATNVAANLTPTGLWFGNSSVNAIINSSAFTGTAYNSGNLNNQPASYYLNATNINAGTIGATYLPTGNSTTIGGLQIVDSVTNTSITITATANNVKAAYDRAATAYSNAVANAASDASAKAATAFSNAVANAASYTDSRIIDSVTNNFITFAASANSVKNAYDRAIDANTRAASAQTAATSAYSNAVTYADGRIIDSVTNNSITFAASANSVKNAYDRAIDANTRATSAQTAAVAAYSNAIAYSGNAALAFTNAVSYVNGLRVDSVISTSVDSIPTSNTVKNAYDRAIDANTRAASAQTAAVAAFSNAVANAASDASTKAATAFSNAVANAMANVSANYAALAGATFTGAVNISNNLVVTGNLIVTGTTFSANVTNLDVTDKNITVAKGVATAALADGAGITVDVANATWNYNNSTLSWQSNVAITPATNNNLGFGTAGLVWSNGHITNVYSTNINATTIGATTLVGNVSAGYVNATGQVNTGTFFATTSANVGANVQMTTTTIKVGNTTLSTTNAIFGGTVAANGGIGSAGQVLMSGAGTNAYWQTIGNGTVTSVASANGIGGGTITGTGTLYVVANNGIVSNTTGVWAAAANGISVDVSGINVKPNTGIVSNTTGVFINSTYIASISANNASFLGTVAAASYVQNTDSRTLSGNLIISATYFNPSANTILLGNSTQRWVLSANTGDFSGAVNAASLTVDGGIITAINYSGTSQIRLSYAAGTKASPTAVSTQSALGSVYGQAYDGTTYRSAGQIGIYSDAAVSSTSSPGFILFATSNTDTITPTERMRITSGGNVGIGFVNPSYKLSVSGDMYASGNSIVVGTVNAAAINLTGQVNTTTFFAATSANVGANVQLTTTQLSIGSISASSNGSVLTNNSLTLGNSSVNSTINSTVYTGTATNAAYLGSIVAASYVTNNGIQTVSNKTLLAPTFSNNISLGAQGVGSVGQVLMSNGAFNNAYWATLTGGAYYKGNQGNIGAVADKGNLYKINSNTQTVSVTIDAGENALTAGPMVIATGYNLTISDGGRVVIV